MDYVYLQDIEFHFEEHKLTTNISEVREGVFQGSVFLRYTPEGGEIASRSDQPIPHSTADAAFEWIVASLEQVMKARGWTLARVSNPCNTDFLERGHQIEILAAHGINVPVLVNGK